MRGSGVMSLTISGVLKVSNWGWLPLTYHLGRGDFDTGRKGARGKGAGFLPRATQGVPRVGPHAEFHRRAGGDAQVPPGLPFGNDFRACILATGNTGSGKDFVFICQEQPPGSTTHP